MRQRIRLEVVVIAASLAVVVTSGCSDSPEAHCVRSGEAKICYVRDNGAAGSLDVSGLQPGSTLTVTSQATGEKTYPINAAGKLDGKVGFINGTGAPVELSVTGTTTTDEILAGTFTT